MSIGELEKLALPWVFLVFWLIHSRRLRINGVAAPTLYISIFAGFSSNFHSIYRELGQAAVLCACLYVVFAALRTKRVSRVNWVFFWLLGFIGISLLANRFSELASIAVVNTLAVALVVNFLLLRLNSRERLGAFFGYFANLCVLMGVAVLFEWIMAGGGRAEGTFSNANYLGYFLGVGACIALTFPQVRRRWLKWAVISVGIYCTGSRASLILPLLAALFFFLGLGVRRVIQAAPLLLIAALLVSVIPSPTNLTGRQGVEGSDQERYTALEVGVEMIKNNPVFGVGWGRFQEEFWSNLGTSKSYFEATEAISLSSQRDMVSHNDFIRIFAELGAAAGVALFILLIYSASSAYRFGGDYRLFLICILAGTIVFSATHNNMNSMLFWFLLLLPLGIRYAGVGSVERKVSQSTGSLP